MANVLIKRSVASQNIDSLNRAVVSESDVENGNVFDLLTRSETDGEDEVWNATAPTTASTAMGLWMAGASEVVITKVGNLEFKGIVEDPREFKNIAGRVFSAFKPMAGDIIEMTLGASSEGDYLIPQDSQMALKTSSSDNATGFSMKKIGTSVLHIGNGALNKTSVPTYIYEVVRN